MGDRNLYCLSGWDGQVFYEIGKVPYIHRTNTVCRAVLKSILLNPSYDLKYSSYRNKIISPVKIFSTTGSSAALMTPKWQRPVEVKMKKTWSVKTIQLGRKHLPCWVVLEMEAGKVYGQSSCIFLFHAEVLNIPTPHAERIDFFCISFHDGMPTGQHTMTVACAVSVCQTVRWSTSKKKVSFHYPGHPSVKLHENNLYYLP